LIFIAEVYDFFVLPEISKLKWKSMIRIFQIIKLFALEIRKYNCPEEQKMEMYRQLTESVFDFCILHPEIKACNGSWVKNLFYL